jgi:hypothetical protein
MRAEQGAFCGRKRQGVQQVKVEREPRGLKACQHRCPGPPSHCECSQCHPPACALTRCQRPPRGRSGAWERQRSGSSPILPPQRVEMSGSSPLPPPHWVWGQGAPCSRATPFGTGTSWRWHRAQDCCCECSCPGGIPCPSPPPQSRAPPLPPLNKTPPPLSAPPSPRGAPSGALQQRAVRQLLVPWREPP